MAKKEFIFSPSKIKQYYKLKENMPKLKEIVAQIVKKRKIVPAKKIIKETSIKPITVYKSLQRLKNEKKIKVIKKEKIPQTPPNQQELFYIKYYSPVKNIK